MASSTHKNIKEIVFMWRFDQGRLDYFQYDEIKQISIALSAANGIVKPQVNNDLIRQILSQYSSRPFAPNSYTVWRNYKRVFGCLLLATEIDGIIQSTNLCNFLAANMDTDVDDYLAYFSKVFYFPSPIFEGYNINDQQVFPVSAILKYILSKFIHTGVKTISIDEIGDCLIANGITGLEPIDFYQHIRPRHNSSDLRQVRELVRFISQFSFLKWDNPFLYFDVESIQDMMRIIESLTPIINPRNIDPSIELLNMASYGMTPNFGNFTLYNSSLFDIEFSEGIKSRVSHVRTERSRKLKDFYFKYSLNGSICNMCNIDTHQKYPWTEYIIDIHHLLPLSSPIRVESGKTSLKDVVGLCPTCHRATHKYYSFWLKSKSQTDFVNYSESHQVYYETKKLLG